MSQATASILDQALLLKSSERADVIEKLIFSLDTPDAKIDEIWAREADARIDAYKRGEIKATPAEKVFSKYQPS